MLYTKLGCLNDWIMVEDCCKNKHNGTQKDIFLQVIDYCEHNDQEWRFETR